MGFLNVKGGVLTYNQYKEKIENYKKHGLMQFCSLYNSQKNRQIALRDLKWGEEMEYQVYVTNQQKIQLSNRGPELIQVFNDSNLSQKNDIVLMPEFGGWMVEAVPTKPYNSLMDPTELLSCQEKLHRRRHVLTDFFKSNGLQLVSSTNVCMLGTENHIDLGEDLELVAKVEQHKNDLKEINPYSESQFVIDKTINTHPRFSGLVKSIRERRGKKVEIKVPIYHDVNTNMTEPTHDEPFPGQIYMDAMHFGMGQCCLQITYECSTINHARYLYDQLLPFTGIMAALSASGPIQKGKLSDNDLRWTVIEQSTDCRTDEERDPNSEKYIPKPRYSAINNYISNHDYVTEQHNDAVPIYYNEEHKQLLKENVEIDDRLAEHVARLFTRDPVPAYEGEFFEDQIDDNDLTCHFENLQSTNWNSLRFKPPPSQNSNIGWRVEFRTMDIQLTDFENTCLIVALGLIVNVINHFDVNFIMPVSKVDENMERAHRRDAILSQKFWFNTNSIKASNFTNQVDVQSVLEKYDYLKSNEDEGQDLQPNYEELFIHEILEGKPESNFPGLLPLIRHFMTCQEYDNDQKQQFEHILEFITARAKGQVPTGANFIRQFILKHQLYNQDSIVSQDLYQELHKEIMKLNQDDVPCDCERDTDSDSCNRDCAHGQDIIKWLKNNGDDHDIFDVDIDYMEDYINQFCSSQAQGQDGNEICLTSEGKQEDNKKPTAKDLEEEKVPEEENAAFDQIVINAWKQEDSNSKDKNPCIKINKMIKKISDNKARARIELLGEQWFQGRTGNVLQEKIVYPTYSEKMNKDNEFVVDSKLISQQEKIMEQISKDKLESQKQIEKKINEIEKENSSNSMKFEQDGASSQDNDQIQS